MSRTYARNAVILVGLVLAQAAAAAAQVTTGDASMNLSGSLSTGYSGELANEGPSGHGISFGGNADLSGFYHSSQFLSFDIAPFYDQSRNNSSYQSILDSSGVTARANIFGGSKYPGYVDYSDVFNSEGNFLLPGIANYRTNGNSQTFGVGWSGRPTDTLSFSAGYEDSSNNSTVYGTSNNIETHFQSIFAALNYTLDGFRMAGGVHYSNGTYSFPEVLTGLASQTSQMSTTTYNFSLSRSVAWDDTTTWLNFSRNATGYNVSGSRDSQTDDVVTAGASLKPTKKLDTSFGVDYDDNLAATLYQAETSVGGVGVAPLTLPAEKSNSWGVYGQAQYSLTDQFYFTGNVIHREQLFLGTSLESTAYGGGVDYGRTLLGGRFTGGAVVTRSDLGSSGGSLLGLWSNAIYTRHVGVWNVSGSFGYSRSAETLLIGYTTSGYSYSTSASRRFGRLNWNGTAVGSKSVLSQNEGTTSFTQSYSTGLSSRWLGANAGYSRSSGMGLYTAQGIATAPSGLPPSLLPSPIFYGGTTYSVGLGGAPVRGLIFSGSFADTRSSTENGLLSSNNHTQEANAYVQYKFRKVFFTSGYSRLVQGFSASTLAPAMVSTYYFGISRWFNFF
jgi:hypothetical protein